MAIPLTKHPRAFLSHVDHALVTEGLQTPADQVLLTLYLREGTARQDHAPLDKVRFSLELTDGRTVPVDVVTRLSERGTGARCDIRPRRTVTLARGMPSIAHIVCRYGQHVHRVPHL